MTQGKLLCLSELPASTDSMESQLLTRRCWAGKERGLIFQGRAAGSTCYQEEVTEPPSPPRWARLPSPAAPCQSSGSPQGVGAALTTWPIRHYSDCLKIFFKFIYYFWPPWVFTDVWAFSPASGGYSLVTALGLLMSVVSLVVAPRFEGAGAR